jgi:RNA polymerase sigma-B factor
MTTLDPDIRALFEERDDAARAELAARFRPLALAMASRFRGRGERLEDLQQVAMLGLIKAIDRYDLDRELAFSTFAVPTIVGEIKRHLRDTGWAVHVPRRLQEQVALVRRTAARLDQDLGRAPTIGELSVATELTTEEVLEALEAQQAYSIASLDAPATDAGGETIGERLVGNDDEAFELVDGWAGLSDALHDVDERERRILYLRFVRNLSQSEIGREIGVSQMHVSRLLTRTLTLLRERLDVQDGAPDAG